MTYCEHCDSELVGGECPACEWAGIEYQEVAEISGEEIEA